MSDRTSTIVVPITCWPLALWASWFALSAARDASAPTQFRVSVCGFALVYLSGLVGLILWAYSSQETRSLRAKRISAGVVSACNLVFVLVALLLNLAPHENWYGPETPVWDAAVLGVSLAALGSTARVFSSREVVSAV